MLKLVKRGRIWHIEGTVRGQRIRESTGTASQPHAETLRLRREQEVLDRQVYGEAVTATFAEAVNLYLDLGGEGRFLMPLVERWGTRKLAEIKPLEIARAARDIYPRAAVSTINRQVYTPTIAVLSAAAEAGLCARPLIRRPKVKRALVEAPSDDWIAALLNAPAKAWRLGSRAAAKQAAATARLRALVLVMTTTGVRVSEAIGILRRDTDLDRGEALVRNTKNGDPRRILLEPEVVGVLRALPDHGPESRLIGYASRDTAYQALERAAEAAGLRHFSPHQVGRHAFAGRMLGGGHTLKTLQEAGGWKSIDVVARHYGHLERSSVDEAVRGAARKLTQTLSQPPANVLSFKRKS